MPKMVERREDMSPLGYLRVIQQDDGDVIVTVVPDPEQRRSVFGQSVEFCTRAGGGRSPRTTLALRELIIAMEKDNAETPSGNPRHGEDMGDG